MTKKKHLHVVELAEAGGSGSVEPSSGLVQLSFEHQRLIVKYRELWL